MAGLEVVPAGPLPAANDSLPRRSSKQKRDKREPAPAAPPPPEKAPTSEDAPILDVLT